MAQVCVINNQRRELTQVFVIARNLTMGTPGKSDKGGIQNKQLF